MNDNTDQRMTVRKYFGTDGVRGTANLPPMTADFALKLGQAIGRKYAMIDNAPHRIVIGKDTRISCYMFEAAMVAGICSQGVDAVLAGSIPTPAVSFLTKSTGADAGAVISASHNPYYDNGIKFFDSEGYKLPDEVELELERMVDAEPVLTPGRIGKALRIEDAVERYSTFVKSTCDVDLRGFKIVVDCANGATYKVAPMVLAELGADIVVINDKPSGTNINDNCGATAPEEMARMVIKHGAKLGISFDGDGDRLIVADRYGNIVDGDFIMGICAMAMKEQGKLAQNTIVATVMSNQGFVNSMDKQGIKVIRSNVGDRYVFESMQKGGYNLGGEQSGHIIFKDFTTTGDGLISVLQLLKVLLYTGKELDELAKLIQLYPQVLRNVEVAEKIPLDKLVSTSALIDKVSQELGSKGRVLVRYSGTEKKLRVMLEGQEQAFIERYALDIANCAVREIESMQ